MDTKKKRAIAGDFKKLEARVARARSVEETNALLKRISGKLDYVAEQVRVDVEECEQTRGLLGQTRTLTEATLAVLHAIDPLLRDEQQRVLLAVNDLLALDRPGDAP